MHSLGGSSHSQAIDPMMTMRTDIPQLVCSHESHRPRDCPQQKAAHGDLNSHNPEMERWQFSKFEDNHRFSLREW